LNLEELFYKEAFSDDWSIVKNEILMAIDIIAVMITIIGRDMVIYAFCRTYGFHIVAAVTGISALYDLCCGVIPMACSVPLIFIGGVCAGKQDIDGLLKYYNKTNFMLVLLSLIFVILFCFALGPLMSCFFSEEDQIVAMNMQTIFRYSAIGLPFFYLNFGQIRLYCIMQSTTVVMVSCFCSLIIQVAYLFLMIYHLKLPLIGAGTSISVGFFIAWIIVIIHFYGFKPWPELISNVFYGVFDEDFWPFVGQVFEYGFPIFLYYLPFDVFPYFGFIISDRAYTALNFCFILLYLTIFFTEGINFPNSVFVNYCIGFKNFNNLLRTYKISMILVGIYLVIVTVITATTFELILNLFSSDKTLVAYAATQKVYFVFATLLSGIITFTNEALLSFQITTYALVSLLVGRIGITTGLIFIFTHLTNLGLSSIFLSYIIGNLVTFIMNIIYIYWLLKNNCKNLQISLLEAENVAALAELEAKKEQ